MQSTEGQESKQTAVKWFYERGGQRIGGITETEIIELIKDTTLRPDSLVWREGFSEWLELSSSELASYIDRRTPPALPATHVSNTAVWVLAFAPLIGAFAQGFIIGIVYFGEEWRVDLAIKNDEFWYTTIVVNILLSIWDERRLENAGVDTNKFKGWVWLVPVYLYSRAKTLKQNSAYFWVWMALFVLTLLS